MSTRTRFATATIACTLLATLTACGGSDSPTTPGTRTPGQQPVTQPPPPPPPSARVASVALTPAGGSMFVGRTMQLVATPRDSAGTALAGRAVTWASSAESIARVDANGVVTAVAAGSATITATSESQSASATIGVQLVPVAAVAVAPATATLRVGDTVTVAATPRDSAGAALTGRTVRYASSAASVASVDSVTGLVRALSGGTATITATSEGRSGTATITVPQPVVPVASVSFGSALDTLEAWDVVRQQVTLRDSVGRVLQDRVVRWTSSDSRIAAIDSVTGVLTGYDRGTVTITATSEGKSATARRVVVIKYRSISAGTEHACDIASGGLVWCWGRNGNQARIGLAQLGENVSSDVPVRLAGDLRFAQLSTFGTTTCGLTRDGKAYCWGYNGWGNLGNGTSGAPSATPVAVAGNLTFKQIALGAQHNCALATDDRIYCWGFNQNSEFGNGNTASSGVPVVAAGGMRFASITAGNEVTCGITTAGAGFCWGHNGSGQLGDGLRLTNGNTYTRTPSAIVGDLTFRSLSASQSYTCGVTTAGQGYCWGSGGSRFGSGFSAETSTPRVIPGYSWKQLSAGSRHACGITTTDEIFCWGGNTYGQMGAPISANGSTTPVRAAGSIRGAEVSAANIATGSAAFTCAIADDRLTTYCWGKNDWGQLGNGSKTGADVSNPNASIVVGQKPLPVTR